LRKKISALRVARVKGKEEHTRKARGGRGGEKVARGARPCASQVSDKRKSAK